MTRGSSIWKSSPPRTGRREARFWKPPRDAGCWRGIIWSCWTVFRRPTRGSARGRGRWRARGWPTSCSANCRCWSVMCFLRPATGSASCSLRPCCPGSGSNWTAFFRGSAANWKPSTGRRSTSSRGCRDKTKGWIPGCRTFPIPGDTACAAARPSASPSGNCSRQVSCPAKGRPSGTLWPARARWAPFWRTFFPVGEKNGR